ncbi:MAG: Hpt domain-containing protein [Thermomonas haemolytica]
MTTALRDAIDHTALGWVKPEIDEALRQARIELEAFAEAPGDPAPMQTCIDHLHQVQGTLRMLELQAPAMVAGEMEQLAAALHAGGVPARDEALAVLMRGVVQLPDYLERLQGGHRDIPIVLLPLINALRVARGASELGQDALPTLLVAPTEAELEHARGSLAGRNRALLDTVAAAIKEDLLKVKDALDLFLRAGHGNVQELQPQVEALDRIGETLGMLGLDSARGVVQEQRRIVHAITSGARPFDEGALMDVAGALIYIDHSLDDQVAHLGAGGRDAEAGDLLAQESRKVMGALTRAAISNFSEVRNAFVAFVETDWDHATLEQVPRLLTEVAGALRILEQPVPAGYLDALRQFTQRELVERRQVPGGQTLDTLADALASMEYFLESLHDPLGQRLDLLDKTRASLEALRYWPLPAAVEAAAPVESAAPAPAASAESDAAIAPDADASAETDADAEIAAGLAAEASAASEAAKPAAVAVDVVPAGAAMAAGFESAGDEIDDEIREIFLEEFQDEISNLDALLPAWRLTPEDAEALRPIRRVFHTLKGSGRLVGAKVLGEFAWHVENMLNRVLDGSRPASPAVVAFVGQARELLPALHAALRDGAVVAANIPAMEAVADRLAAGEDVLIEAAPVAVVEADAAAAPAQEPAPAAAAEPETAEVLVDPVLLEILGAEVGGHLETMQAWLAGARAGEARADSTLLRAIHTLNGAFAMSEVPTVTAFTAPAEGYVKRLLAAQQPADAAGLAALVEVAEAVRASTLALQVAPTQVPVYAALAARMAALRDTLPEASLPFVDHAQLAAEDAARQEAERQAAEEAARQEAERLAAEQAAAEAALLEAERLAAEQAEAERLAAEEAARAEAERLAAEQAAAEEAARREAERLEMERIAAARAEAERLEAERIAAARAEAERREAERRAAEAAAAARARELAALAALQSTAAAAEDPDEALDTRELDLELVDIFVEEAGDLLDHSDGLLAQLRETPDDNELIVGLQRDLHTLKGGARMAGVMAAGELGHAMETLLEAVAAQRVELGDAGVALLERSFDRLHTMITRIAARRAIGMPDGLIGELNARAENRAPAPAAPAAEPSEAAPARPEAQAPKPVLTPLSAPIRPEGAFEDDEIGVRAPQEQVRIRADLLDRLVNYAGEVAIYRARLEQQLSAFRSTAAEMEQTNLRLRDQLRRLDAETEAQIIARFQRESDSGREAFDPLELDRFSTLQQLSRALAESAADLQSLHGSMEELTRQYETLLTQQSRVSSELQEGLMRTRMLPFDSLVPRLRRVIRQAAAETGKQAQLRVEGAQGELDRNVLERMTAPLEHMLRNAIAHGLETPQARLAAGKPEEGSIRIAVRREGAEVVLQVSDDGAGLNRAAIRARGIERGLISADAELTDAELYQLIMQPGFSTAETVSRLAGRGVGMDVVASEVRQLGGSIDIASRPGTGTTFTLRLPQTLAVTQAVFVKIGETEYAVPIAAVRGVGRIAREELAQAGAAYRYGGEDYALHDLGVLVGTAPAKAEGHLQMPLLLVGSGELRAAVAVDQVLGSREIVVKTGGPQLASIPGIFGATIMGDGRVVVILDVAPLVRRQATLAASGALRHAAAAPVETRRVPLVMVVDDSVTMRKVTSRVLERHGFEVATAKDGLDALERMAELVPDLMLLDIEMPRMDGYELATAMKADVRLRDVPIVMITSRTGEKHRQRAMEIGVERYLGKPYQEPELMRNVFELLKLEYAGDGLAQ